MKLDEKNSLASEARAVTNRLNALKSTGPIDTSLTRFNALKHGLTAEKIVVTGSEKPEEYVSLLDGLRRDFEPQTTLENILIEQMASSLWRRYRIIRAEKAKIEEELAYAPIHFQELEDSRLNRFRYPDPVTITGEKREAEETLNRTRKARGERYREKHIAPQTDALTIRYDSSLERQFYRAMIMLLKVKDARAKGIGFVSQKNDYHAKSDP